MMKERRQLYYDNDYIREVEDHINYEKLFYDGTEDSIETNPAIKNNRITTTKIANGVYRTPKIKEIPKT